MAEDYNEGFKLSDTLSRTEYFVENNKKNLLIGLGVVAAAVIGYFVYKNAFIAPQEEEAREQMFIAERYFEQDSLRRAINGDGNFPGFQDIVNEFGMTKSANLASYYLGISYLKTGKYQEAIDALKDYDAKDRITGPLATGAIGDAYMELGQTEDAISYYKKAADMDDNKFSTAMFLMKAGQAYESVSNYSEALELYKKIKQNYFDTNEGRDIDKYIARAEGMSSK
jgi:tetratricopeptide (TPR) repeat protein